MSDTTPTAVDAAAPAKPTRPPTHTDPPGRLLAYRVTLEGGDVEIHEGHSVSQPTKGFVRIHRCFDGIWQLVFAGRADVVRTVRAIAPDSLEYKRLMEAQSDLRTALDHLGRLVAGLGDCTQGYASGGYCHASGHSSSDDEGCLCDVVAARKFLDQLRPF